ncbi:sulfite reductase subunit alpha [Roseibium sp.]|uniref:sulfite reductase subunit alpha n=1 Tax=Roseibium sp. TaxID=1936156 RepID=UPI003A981CBA
MQIPFIPKDAPFNEDQRSWLSGFLAGLHSRLAMPVGQGQAVAPQAGAQASLPVNILYGTQTGNAEGLANDAAEVARGLGLSSVVQGLDDIDLDAFAAMVNVVIVVSTYGEGEMPDNAQLFWDALSADTAPRLESMTFCVLALGDTGYDDFCQAGKLIDMRLEQLGAQRIADRIDCDIDFEDPAANWLNDSLGKVSASSSSGAGVATTVAPASKPKSDKPGWSRKNPYRAELQVNRRLSGEGSSKEIRHYEFALGDSGVEYQAGDALGVMPVNDPVLISGLLERLGGKADADVKGLDGSVGEALTSKFEISTPSRDLVAEIERRAGDEELTHVVHHGDKEALDAWLWGKDVLDLVQLLPEGQLPDLETFISLLKPLQHRAYSISSSPLVAGDSVHLTVASVRYSGNGRVHGGVCSTYLADRVGDDDRPGIFVSPNKAFRVPEDTDRPVIMVGPGTGIAPFRAFLQERQATGAKGRNWLFFGDQHKAHDFIYEDELAAMVDQGVLSRMDLAFSRDQDQKIYVQHRMKENGKDLFAWLEDGGYFYVCGDALRMAKDVDQALHEVITEHGGKSPDEAEDYVATLKREKRYLRDVY